jgi:hypothetical protein
MSLDGLLLSYSKLPDNDVDRDARLLGWPVDARPRSHSGSSSDSA